MVILELECWRDIKYSWIGDFDVHETAAELNSLGFHKTTSQAKKYKQDINTEEFISWL